MSGGEKQRITLARAILKNAPIVILDEATAYIDADNEDLLQKALAKLSEGKTVLVIALKQADDAALVDSSEMGIDDVVNAILDVYNKKVQK